MKISKIMQLKRQAIKEAQKEVDKIFYKYSAIINAEIAKELPEGKQLRSGNGMCWLEDENGQTIKNGTGYASGYYKGDNPKLDKIALLQYGTSTLDIKGIFQLEDLIKAIAQDAPK